MKAIHTLAITITFGFAACTAPQPSDAKITQAAAQKTALTQVPHGKVASSELEKEHGLLVWSFDIATPGSKNITEVLVDANTGKVVATEIESPADQAREAAADKKARH